MVADSVSNTHLRQVASFKNRKVDKMGSDKLEKLEQSN